MPSSTIKKIVADINSPDSDGGGLWLPNIQRKFVWNEDQITTLFDSILRQYPLSSMLLWKTKEQVRHRRFIDEYQDSFDLKLLYRSSPPKLKRLVLDGQQRLQSLFIGLKGSIDGATLHFDVTSGDLKSPDEIAYEFAFKSPERAQWPWVPLSSMIYTKKLAEEIVANLVKKHSLKLSDAEKNKITRNIARAKREIEVAEAIVYQEIDGTDEDENYSFEDVVEIFIRANSGGTKLGKSELMFTLLKSDWDTADIEMDAFLEEINDNRFEFSQDFVLKTAMSVLEKGAKYDVDKLRDEKIRKLISDKWGGITDAIRFVKDQIVEKTFVRSNKALTSYNTLIPLIYFYYHFPKEWKTIRPIKDYLLRSLMAGAFSGSPDGLIDKITSDIKKRKGFDKRAIFRLIEEKGKSMEISSDSLLYSFGYGSGQIHLLFNLWYENDYRPAFDGHLPQIDHIFPQSVLRGVKELNSKSGRMVQRYSAWEINQLGNCMLLTAKENGAGDKSDTLPEIWLKGKSKEFLTLHCIPQKRSLWKLENYEEFIEARGELICEKFADLLLDEEEE